eukprot:364589-Chlamydomonas_euryale.AAC.5
MPQTRVRSCLDLTSHVRAIFAVALGRSARAAGFWVIAPHGMHVVLEVFVRDVHGFKYTHGELGAAFAGIDVPCLRRLDALHGISYAVPERVIRNPATLSRTCVRQQTQISW